MSVIIKEATVTTTALAVLLLAAAVAAQSQPLNLTAPANATLQNITLQQVDQAIPSFYAIRSCLPFNVLVLPSNASSNISATGPLGSPGDNTNGTGRVVFVAEQDVINATNVTVTNGVLALSLAHGFATRQAIQLTVYTALQPLVYAGSFGSGDLVLGPGIHTTSLAIYSSGVSQVKAFNMTVQDLAIVTTGYACMAASLLVCGSQATEMHCMRRVASWPVLAYVGRVCICIYLQSSPPITSPAATLIKPR